MKELFILLLIFFTYSFLGWLMEVLLSIFQHHKFINRGFLIGPICPIYGCGGVIILLLLQRYADDPLVLFFMSIIICAVLEYFTSYIMEKIFKNRWWDYSDMKYNINGRICLECAIPFGIGAVILFYGVNPIIIPFFSQFDVIVIKSVAIGLLVLFIIDLALSFNIIINLKNISNNIRSDSTEMITKKVKEILKGKDILHRRLLDSFPRMKVFNTMSLIKKRIIKDKKNLKEEKKKARKRIHKKRNSKK